MHEFNLLTSVFSVCKTSSCTLALLSRVFFLFTPYSGFSLFFFSHSVLFVFFVLFLLLFSLLCVYCEFYIFQFVCLFILFTSL